MAPWADVLYGADWPWWVYYQGVPAFRGKRWTQQRPSGGRPIDWAAVDRWDIRVVHCVRAPDISTEPARIHRGGNSGFQALNLAVLFGAARILLLGFDMGGKHFLRDRPPRFVKGSPFEMFIAAFDSAAATIAGLGVEVINCSPVSRLTCFPKARLEDAL